MRTRYANSVVWSAGWHVALVILVMAGSFVAQRSPTETRIFELVAGEGDNFMATEAPALGSPDAAPAPTLAPTPPIPAIKPTPAVPTPAPKADAPVKAPAPKAAETVTKSPAQPKAPAPKTAPAPTTTYADFTKNNPVKQPATKAPAPQQKAVPRVTAPGIAGGVVGGSTANTKGGAGGTALKAEEGAAFERWASLLRSRLRENLQPPPNASDNLEALVRITVTAAGQVSGRILRSSGDAAFDEAVRTAIARTPTIVAPPPGKHGDFDIPFRRRDLAGE